MGKPKYDSLSDVAAEEVLQIYGKAEAKEWARGWRKVFTGKRAAPGMSQYLWHTFSGESFPSVSGEEAEALYESHRNTEVIVLSNEQGAAMRVKSGPRADRHIDFYVFPPDFAWTMAFTHEDGWLGPYFAKHPNYPALAKAAAMKRQKAEAIVAARKNGWL
ncbi:DUF4275 family protein [Hydrogenophaga sp. 5NK40-0174]|uniref:DUF4275 family protein n=1 Tax=Hydrogenophaga sp. 5NK40-0174 TaxID=3127649 RepID=UPI00310B4A9F